MKRRISIFRLMLLLFVVLLSIYLFLHSSIFKIKKIAVLGNNRVSQEEVLALAGLSPGSNLFDFDEQAVTRAVETHPLINKAEIKRHLDRTVSIQIQERQVWAVIPYQDSFLCIDSQGICFDKINSTPVNDCPIITLQNMPANIDLGQAVNSEATDMIRQVWQAIPVEERPSISEFHFINDQSALNIYTVQGTEIRFGNLERLDEKVKTFAQILQMEKDMEKQGSDTLEYVDIRYNGEPVIKTRS